MIAIYSADINDIQQRMQQNVPYEEDVISLALDLRRDDPDRYLVSLFAPGAQARADLWALFSFYNEIARTPEVTHDPALGRMRLQWWREALQAEFAGERAAYGSHPVMPLLRAAALRHGLVQDELMALIDARAYDYGETRPQNLDEFADYACASSVPLWTAALRICGENPALHPVYAVALNYALVGLLRAAPFSAARGFCVLPGVSPATAAREKLSSKVMEIMALFDPRVRPGPRILKAVQALARMHARRITAMHGDVYAPAMVCPPRFRELRVAMRVFIG